MNWIIIALAIIALYVIGRVLGKAEHKMDHGENGADD